MDVFPPCAQLHHRLDRRVGDPGERSTPTGVRGADDDGLMIGEKHWGAIRGQNAEQQIGRVRDHCVGARSLAMRPWFIGNHDVGGMNLVNGRERSFGEDRGDSEAAITLDCLAVVTASETDVQPFADTDGNAPASSKEAMRQLTKANRPNDFDAAQSTFRMMMSSSACFPTMKS